MTERGHEGAAPDKQRPPPWQVRQEGVGDEGGDERPWGARGSSVSSLRIQQGRQRMQGRKAIRIVTELGSIDKAQSVSEQVASGDGLTHLKPESMIDIQGSAKDRCKNEYVPTLYAHIEEARRHFNVREVRLPDVAEALVGAWRDQGGVCGLLADFLDYTDAAGNVRRLHLHSYMPMNGAAVDPQHWLEQLLTSKQFESRYGYRMGRRDLVSAVADYSVLQTMFPVPRMLNRPNKRPTKQVDYNENKAAGLEPIPASWSARYVIAPGGVSEPIGRVSIQGPGQDTPVPVNACHGQAGIADITADSTQEESQYNSLLDDGDRHHSGWPLSREVTSPVPPLHSIGGGRPPDASFLSDPGDSIHTDLQVWSLNIDGAAINSYDDICEAIRRQLPDVVCIVDTRHMPNDKRVQLKVQTLLGHKYRVFMHVDAESHTAWTKRVGGVLFIVGPRVSHPHLDRLCHRGSTAGLSFKLGKANMYIIGTYWPVMRNEEDTLYGKIRKFADGDPIHHIKHMIRGALLRAREKRAHTLVVGDFNSDVNNTGSNRHDQYKLSDFILGAGLVHSSALCYRTQCSYRHGTPPNSVSSRIDYQLQSAVTAMEVSCFPLTFSADYTGQHLPVVARYKVPSGLVHPTREPIKERPQVDVRLGDAKRVTALQKKLGALARPIGEGTELLEMLQSTIVKMVVSVFGRKKRAAERQGWSVQSQAILIAMEMCVRFARCNNKHGKVSTRQRRLVLAEWRQRTRKLAGEGKDAVCEGDIRDVAGVEFMYTFWLHATATQMAQAEVAFYSLRRRLHARKKRDSRVNMSQRAADMEAKRESGQPRAAIRSILGSKTKGIYALDSLNCNGVMETDPVHIDRQIRTHFAEVFSYPAGCPNIGLQGPDADWRVMDGTFDDFCEVHAALNVPPDILSRLWDASRRKTDIDGTMLQYDCVEAVPTWKEFESAIKDMPVGSAPGVSGLSYNMLKVLPEAVAKWMYEALCTIWLNKEHPPSWRWRWLILAPKVEDPTMDQLRPISLVEVARKVWASIVLAKVAECWERDDLLSISQNMFVKGRSMDLSVLMLANALETAREWKSDIYLCSWDFVKAFDRVPFQVQIWALIRLGVPEVMAEYLVRFEMEAMSVVKTPLACKSLVEGYAALERHGFSPRVGMCQGNNDSSYKWVAAIDILNSALNDIDKAPGGNFNIHVGGSLTYCSTDPAAADDLISIAGTRDIMQLKADVVSGFCAIFGMQIDIKKKLRCFSVKWGHPNRDGVGAPEEEVLVIRTHGWQPHLVPMASDGTLKYLGVRYDMSLHNQVQYDLAVDQLTLAMHKLGASRLSLDTKIQVLHTSVLQSVVYHIKYAPWALTKFRLLDAIVARGVRQWIQARDFPTRLIYTPARYGGLGIIRISDLAHYRKLSMFARFDKSGSLGRITMESMALRGLSAIGALPPPGYGGWIRPPLSTAPEISFATSIAQWCRENGLRFEVCGDAKGDMLFANTDTIEPIGGLPSGTLCAAGISMLSETPLGSIHVELRVTQVWRVHWCKTSVFEICGFDEIGGARAVNVIEWEGVDGINVTRGSKVAMHSGTRTGFHRGAGTPTTILLDNLFSSGDHTLMVLSGDVHMLARAGRSAKTVRTVIGAVRKTPILEAHCKQVHPDTTKLRDLLAGATQVYTDGSYAERGSLSQHIRGTAQCVATAAVVARLPDDSYRALRICLNGVVSAAEPELVGAALAHANGSTHMVQVTDCKSLISLQERAQAGKTTQYHQRSLLTSMADTRGTSLTWKASHPDQKKKALDDTDYGVIMADAAAAGLVVPETGGRKCDHWGDLDPAVLTDLVSACNTTVVHMGSPVLQHVRLIIERNNLQQYLTERDEARQTRQINPGPAKWSVSTWKHAACVYECSKRRSARKRALDMRILYDKHRHGGWVALLGVSEPETYCSICGGRGDGQQHIIRGCTDDAMAQARHILEQGIDTVVRKEEANGSRLSAVYRAYYKWATSTNAPCSLWTCMYTSEVQLRLDEIIAEAGLDQSQDMKRAYVEFTQHLRHYAEATRSIYRARARRMQEKKGIRCKGKRCPRQKGPLAGKHRCAPVSGDIRRWLCSPSLKQCGKAPSLSEVALEVPGVVPIQGTAAGTGSSSSSPQVPTTSPRRGVVAALRVLSVPIDIHGIMLSIHLQFEDDNTCMEGLVEILTVCATGDRAELETRVTGYLRNTMRYSVSARAPIQHTTAGNRMQCGYVLQHQFWRLGMGDTYAQAVSLGTDKWRNMINDKEEYYKSVMLDTKDRATTTEALSILRGSNTRSIPNRLLYTLDRLCRPYSALRCHASMFARVNGEDILVSSTVTMSARAAHPGRYVTFSELCRIMKHPLGRYLPAGPVRKLSDLYLNTGVGHFSLLAVGFDDINTAIETGVLKMARQVVTVCMAQHAWLAELGATAGPAGTPMVATSSAAVAPSLDPPAELTAPDSQASSSSCSSGSFLQADGHRYETSEEDRARVLVGSHTRVSTERRGAQASAPAAKIKGTTAVRATGRKSITHYFKRSSLSGVASEVTLKNIQGGTEGVASMVSTLEHSDAVGRRTEASDMALDDPCQVNTQDTVLCLTDDSVHGLFGSIGTHGVPMSVHNELDAMGPRVPPDIVSGTKRGQAIGLDDSSDTDGGREQATKKCRREVGPATNSSSLATIDDLRALDTSDTGAVGGSLTVALPLRGRRRLRGLDGQADNVEADAGRPCKLAREANDGAYVHVNDVNAYEYTVNSRIENSDSGMGWPPDHDI